MEIDSVGLGFTAEGTDVIVHYPVRQPDGQSRYGAGFPTGPIPSLYYESQPNAITAERVRPWKRLLSRPESVTDTTMAES